VQLSTVSTFATTIADDSTLTAGTKAITGLVSGTTYYWRANAKNTAGTSAWSSMWSFTTAVGAPVAPVLTNPANAATGIATSPTLTWGTVSNAATYRVQLSAVSTFATTIVNDSTLTAGTKAIAGLANGTTYYWRVNAKNIGGISAWSSAWSFTTVALPAAPVLVAPANGDSLSIQKPVLKWNTVATATTYRVQVSTASTFATLLINDSTRTTSTDTVATILSAGTYYWRVNAKNANGIGDWSSIWSFRIYSTGIIEKYSIAKNYKGTIAIYQINGTRVMEAGYTTYASPAQLFKSVGHTLAKGCYLYKIRSFDMQIQRSGVIINR
jgi:hypothetical protein